VTVHGGHGRTAENDEEVHSTPRVVMHRARRQDVILPLRRKHKRMFPAWPIEQHLFTVPGEGAILR
jgi:hypothetical protein